MIFLFATAYLLMVFGLLWWFEMRFCQCRPGWLWTHDPPTPVSSEVRTASTHTVQLLATVLNGKAVIKSSSRILPSSPQDQDLCLSLPNTLERKGQRLERNLKKRDLKRSNFFLMINFIPRTQENVSKNKNIHRQQGGNHDIWRPGKVSEQG